MAPDHRWPGVRDSCAIKSAPRCSNSVSIHDFGLQVVDGVMACGQIGEEPVETSAAVESKSRERGKPSIMCNLSEHYTSYLVHRKIPGSPVEKKKKLI